MTSESAGEASKAIHYLVADALESLLPQVDGWAEDVRGMEFGQHALGYRDGYAAGINRMAAEIKDQLVARILALREA